MNKLILLIALLYSVNCMGQEYKEIENYKPIEKSIVDANSKIKSLQATFVQEKHLEILNKPFISEGKFYYLEPNNVRWEYLTPFSYKIILQNTTVKIKDGDDLQNHDMSKNPIFKEINNIMNGMVSGKMLTDENFKTKYFQNNEYYKVSLNPQNKSVKSFITNIDLIFNNKTLQLDKIVMHETGNDKTIIRFENQKVNTNLPISIFNEI